MMAKEYNETTNKLTNKDLKNLGLRSMFYQTGFTFEKCRVIVSAGAYFQD